MNDRDFSFGFTVGSKNNFVIAIGNCFENVQFIVMKESVEFSGIMAGPIGLS